MLGAMLSEPLPALTDLALGLVALLFAIRGVSAGVSRAWRRMFWWAAIAALAGAVHHAVILTYSDGLTGPSWALISVMVVVTISDALAATVEDVLGPGRGRIFWGAADGQPRRLRRAGAVRVLRHQHDRRLRGRHDGERRRPVGTGVPAGIPGAGPMVVALAANVFAGISRAFPSSITELVGLDPVSLYHLAQIPPMALLYVAIVERSAIPVAPAVPAVAVDDDAPAR